MTVDDQPAGCQAHSLTVHDVQLWQFRISRTSSTLESTWGAVGDSVGARDGEVYSYCELEHEASGPTLAVGLWRMAVPPAEPMADMSVLICFAKAKMLGVKRIVHRVSIPLHQLLGKKTTISWISDGNWGS